MYFRDRTLDLVLELILNGQMSPKEVLQALANRLRQHDTYASMVEVKKRCVRLKYAGKFHLDILPATPDGSNLGTSILIPDRELQEWLPSDPKGYAEWFKQQSQRISLREAAVEPLPGYQPASKKLPLQLATQLLKRWRSVVFSDKKEQEPPSIVLTTLAGEAYGGEPSVSGAITSIIAGIAARIQATGSRVLEVRNPANSEELLSEKWVEDPTAYELFKSKISELSTAWDVILTAQDAQRVSSGLSALYGKEVTSAYKRQAELMKGSKAFVDAKSGVISTTAVGKSVPVKDHTFYGEE
jgi:hypothetical protein